MSYRQRKVSIHPAKKRLATECHTDEGEYLFLQQKKRFATECHTDEGEYLFGGKPLQE